LSSKFSLPDPLQQISYRQWEFRQERGVLFITSSSHHQKTLRVGLRAEETRIAKEKQSVIGAIELEAQDIKKAQ